MRFVHSLLLLFVALMMMMMMMISSSNMALAEETGQCSGQEGEEGSCTAASNQSSPTSSKEDPSCPSRSHLIKCSSAYLDLNHNEKLERAELQTAIDALPWYARGLLNILGSVDKIMKRCDIDGDDAIGMDYDMQHNHETCLTTCLKRRVFKKAFFPNCDL